MRFAPIEHVNRPPLLRRFAENLIFILLVRLIAVNGLDPQCLTPSEKLASPTRDTTNASDWQNELCKTKRQRPTDGRPVRTRRRAIDSSAEAVPRASRTHGSPTPTGPRAKSSWRTTDTRPGPAAVRHDTGPGSRASTDSTTCCRARSADNSRRDRRRNDSDRPSRRGRRPPCSPQTTAKTTAAKRRTTTAKTTTTTSYKPGARARSEFLI